MAAETEVKQRFADGKTVCLHEILIGVLQRSENLLYKRGDVFWTELSPVVGSEQNGLRPAVILQNNIGNRHSPTVIIAPLTTNLHKGKNLPTHVEVRLEGFPPSVVLLEQVRTVDKSRLGKMAGHLDDHTMAKIGECILLCLGL